jgi:transcriptional regulator with XRE-family HTH domain
MTKGHRADRLMHQFGRRLRAARITAGYEEATDFASDLGIEAPRYRKYERGSSMPPLDVLEAITKLTGRTLDWLLLGRMPDKP